MASDDLEARRAMITHEAVIDTGRYLKALRHEAGLTQKELSERAGMTQARISIIENGNSARGPSVDVIARIADVCNKAFVLNLLAR